MNIKKLIEDADLRIEQSKILYEEPMSKHTSFKIGGPAECFIKIDNIEDLKQILEVSKENHIPLTIIGNGSNLLVLDGGVKGIVLKIQIEECSILEQEDRIKVIVSSGMKIGKLARILLKEKITGFEELSGIPGTIGGAVRMNAGAHGKEIKDIVKRVKCIDYQGNEKTFNNQELEFGYRKSMLKNNRYIVTEVELELQKGNEDMIKQKMEEYAKYRKEKQPIEYPSAGSTFKRGKDFITAKLIDDAGLKGYTIGGAEVSIKHSGFIINKGNATAKEIIQLVEYIKEEVYKKFSKKIELEIEVIGEE
ncbi:MAG: UDP-N-acetylmuramate dehydrogenase [Clostridia bacterium]|nr:UDP-N-acetylmuramate dehydrogenase [Clostridia bacterium]